MRKACGRKLRVVRIAAMKPSVSSAKDPGCMWKMSEVQGWRELVRRARPLSVGKLFDAIATHGVVHRGPGQARPFDLGVFIGFERTMPFLAAAGGRLLELGVGIRPADHPEPRVARFLFDPVARAGVVDRIPRAALPFGLRLFAGPEGTKLVLRTPVLHAVEFGVGVGSADHPVALHDENRCKSIVNPGTYYVRKRSLSMNIRHAHHPAAPGGSLAQALVRNDARGFRGDL